LNDGNGASGSIHERLRFHGCFSSSPTTTFWMGVLDFSLP
jgi:hypothetical protein